MIRISYFSIVLCLLGASAVTASGLPNNQGQLAGGAGFVLLTSLQR